MSGLVKMKIFSFKSDEYSGSPESNFTVQVNPESIKFGKAIETAKKQAPIGRAYRGNKYAGHKETSFSIDVLLDATGLISTLDIAEEVEKLEKVVYTLNGAIHQPNFLKVSWGNFIFKGTLSSINYDYTLFTPEGKPLRVKVSLTLNGYMNAKEAAKKENKQSPDLSRIITLKAGESIPYWCNEIYGDASYCIDIANYNKLSNFRNIKPGTQLMFPPLIR